MAEAPLLISRSLPLGAITPRTMAGIASDVVAIRPLPPRLRFSLRLAPALLLGDARVAGFRLDMAIHRRTASAGRAAMRLGPDEWLLSACENESAEIARDVEAALAGRQFSLVNIGHGQTGLAVSGARAVQIVNAGCPLDLAPSTFPTGCATRTLVGKCEAILSRVDDTPTFEIECARSFATYLHDFLCEAMRGTDPLDLA
jgi:sarcosine oxidase, subunit gamma